jgi:hypothetical protein
MCTEPTVLGTLAQAHRPQGEPAEHERRSDHECCDARK